MFATEPSKHFINVINKAANQNINIVVVLFAEDYLGYQSYKELISSGVKGIMLDTRIKTSRHLRSILNNNELRDFIRNVKASQLLTGLAGSLRYNDIDVLLDLKSDYLGFRGALCSENDRKSRIDLVKVKEIRNAIPQRNNFNYDLNIDQQEGLRHGTVA